MHAYGTAIKMEDLKTVMKKYDVDGMGKLSCKGEWVYCVLSWCIIYDCYHW